MLKRSQIEEELQRLLSRKFPSNIDASVALAIFRRMANAGGFRGQFKGYRVADGIITDDPKVIAQRGALFTPSQPIKPEIMHVAEMKPETLENGVVPEKYARKGPKPRSLKREEKKFKDPKPAKTKAKRFRH